MSRTTRIRKIVPRSLGLAILALGLAGVAEARDETVRWTHPLGDEVASFHILVGTSPGAADVMSQAIGVPTPDAQGVYSYVLSVSTQQTLYVRMEAVDASSVHSAPSNEISRTVPLGMPGQPTVIAP